jgi:hypothetical protein
MDGPTLPLFPQRPLDSLPLYRSIIPLFKVQTAQAPNHMWELEILLRLALIFTERISIKPSGKAIFQSEKQLTSWGFSIMSSCHTVGSKRQDVLCSEFGTVLQLQGIF